jgi:hypothetical protein
LASLFKAILIASNVVFGECVYRSVSSHKRCPLNGLPLEISYKPSAEYTLIEISLGAVVIRHNTGGHDLAHMNSLFIMSIKKA